MKSILKSRDTLYITVVALSLIINWFFFWHKVGITFVLFSIIWILVFETIKSVYLETHKLTKYHLFIIPILFFSSVFLFRVNYFVLFLASLMYWINAFLYVFLTINPNFLQRISDMEIIKMLARTIISFGNIFNLPQESKKIESDVIKKIFMGFILTIPLLTIVTLLLASADEVFSDFIQKIGETIVPDITILNVFGFVLALILTYIGTSYVIGLIKYSNQKIVRSIADSKYHADLIIPSILSYSLNLIYLAFVYIQFKYLFGGEEYVNSQGIIYSEYAIKGFWEMIVVCLINFGILYFLIGKFSLGSSKFKSFMIPSYLLIIISSFVMVYSSHVRLSLYETGYGYSIDRLIPHSFLVFMVLVLVLLGISLAFKDIYRNKMLILGIFLITNIFIAGFTIFPMEKFIVRQNVARSEQGKELDKKYLVVNLGLEGFNEVLNQIEKGELEKEMLMTSYNVDLLEEQLKKTDPGYAQMMEDYDNDNLDSYNHYSYAYDEEHTKLYSLTEKHRLVKNHKWQSWNIEYQNFKNHSEKLLNDKQFCLNGEITCDMI